METTRPEVMRVCDVDPASLENLLARFKIKLHMTQTEQIIPGSYWGDDEAGLIADTVYARQDTPIHSVLHEAGHYICMSSDRRNVLDTNAGGDYDEENGVCYLQILLAEHLPRLNKNRMLADMDRWGYTFRLGSAQSWFETDAQDAYNWLIEKGIIDNSGQPRWQLRRL